MGFKINLRRYIEGILRHPFLRPATAAATPGKVGRCRLTLTNPRESAWNLALDGLKLQYDEQLSHFAFKFNLLRYSKAAQEPASPAASGLTATQLTNLLEQIQKHGANVDVGAVTQEVFRQIATGRVQGLTLVH